MSINPLFILKYSLIAKDINKHSLLFYGAVAAHNSIDLVDGLLVGAAHVMSFPVGLGATIAVAFLHERSLSFGQMSFDYYCNCVAAVDNGR